MKPLVLMDVDGVLAPLGARVPAGYEARDLGDLGVMAINVVDNTRRLAQLADVFDVVWCTARETDAVSVIGPLHGLADALEHVPTGSIREPGLPIVVPANPAGGSWKLPKVQAWVSEHAAGRCVAWVDDDLGRDCERWAQQRACGIPTMLRRVDPRVGLSDVDVDALLTFAAGRADGDAALRR